MAFLTKHFAAAALLAVSLTAAPAVAQETGNPASPVTIGDLDGNALALSARDDISGFLSRGISAQQLQAEIAAALLADPSLASLLLGPIFGLSTETSRVIGAGMSRAAVLAARNGDFDTSFSLLFAISNAPRTGPNGNGPSPIQNAFATFQPERYDTVLESEGEALPAQGPDGQPLSPFF